MKSAVILKKGKESIFFQRHHWIFSGAIESYPEGYQDGDLTPIYSSTKELLGCGFFQKGHSLAGRIVSFGSQEVYAALQQTLKTALKLRVSLLHSPHTTACRLINGEGDGLPGLIVDKYGPYLVVQTGALGMHKLLPFFVEHLQAQLEIQGIYDKTTEAISKEENIVVSKRVLWGEVPDVVEIKEENIRYRVWLKTGQKTGFFLDQREMRKWMGELAHGRRVLNGFCYTGGFTLAALKGGAAKVDSVDISAAALEGCKENVALNGYLAQEYYQEDVFEFLERKGCDYDLVILDPPAFAKKKKDLAAALKGYKRLFGLALKKMPPASVLMLSSCSHYITEPLFETVIQQAALEAKREVRLIGRHRLALDHPINPFHPESAYLKSAVLSL